MKALTAAAAALLCLTACAPDIGAPKWKFNGDAKRGAVQIIRSSCGDCHVIPGIELANGQVGPPLTHFAQRTIVAGLLPNTPDNLTRWIAHPQAVTPGNAMPDSGLTDQEARDVAAYLYTLR